MPARLTRPATGGSSESIRWYAAVTEDSDATSAGSASNPEWPASRSSFSTTAKPSALTSTRATCQPFSASSRAVTRPIPAGPPAPVTTAVRGSGNRGTAVGAAAAATADVMRLLVSYQVSVDQGGEDVSDVRTVPSDHRDGVAAVVLAEEGTAEAQVERLADRGPVVDQAELHWHREGHHLAGLLILIAQVA